MDIAIAIGDAAVNGSVGITAEPPEGEPTDREGEAYKDIGYVLHVPGCDAVQQARRLLPVDRPPEGYDGPWLRVPRIGQWGGVSVHGHSLALSYLRPCDRCWLAAWTQPQLATWTEPQLAIESPLYMEQEEGPKIDVSDPGPPEAGNGHMPGEGTGLADE
ncbi:MAG: hypothetical protein ACE5MI_11010 [Acidimicrobiia bacterium]